MERHVSWLSGYTNPKILIILFLGFSSGLPIMLVFSTFSAWLKEAGIETAAIALFSWVSIPYSLNFAWAPLIDHLRLGWLTRRFGQRRSWMLLMQFGVMLSLFMMSLLDPAQTPWLLASAAVMVAFFSASQDVVIDAYRTEYLQKEEYGRGASMAVFGYRIGMLVAGAGGLALADEINWQQVYLIMALLMPIGMITVLLTSEPEITRPKLDVTSLREWITKAVLAPFQAFAAYHKQWLLILLFVAFYRLPDGFIGFMANPFLLELGFEKTEIAVIAKLYGFGATLVGMLLGGLAVERLGVWWALLLFGLAQLSTNLVYVLIAMVGPESWALVLAITVDNFAGGGVAAAAIAFMMGLCDTRFTATQYALLASLASLARVTLSGAAGWVAEQFGWVSMFGLSALLGLPALMLLIYIRRHAAFILSKAI